MDGRNFFELIHFHNKKTFFLHFFFFIIIIIIIIIIIKCKMRVAVDTVKSPDTSV